MGKRHRLLFDFVDREIERLSVISIHFYESTASFVDFIFLLEIYRILNQCSNFAFGTGCLIGQLQNFCCTSLNCVMAQWQAHPFPDAVPWHKAP